MTGTRPRLREVHRTDRIGWLRAAVLGANDGLISMGSLVVGVAAGGANTGTLLLAAVAGTVAGAISMAAGEYVSVSSQADTEAADLELERREQSADPAAEREELAAIYVKRGLDPALATTVATQLMATDPIGAHMRDELGHSETSKARPLQAAMASAVAFSVGAAPPTILAGLAPVAHINLAVMSSTIILLLGLGSVAARLGGAPAWKGAVRVTFWGVVAMVATSLVGRLFGAAG